MYTEEREMKRGTGQAALYREKVKITALYREMKTTGTSISMRQRYDNQLRHTGCAKSKEVLQDLQDHENLIIKIIFC